RIDVQAVFVTSNVEKIERKFTEKGFSRLPGFEKKIEEIKRIIILKDFYQEGMKGQKKTKEIIKPVAFIVKTIKIKKKNPGATLKKER
ncbi:hypothetical protein, partial [Treponema sp. R6D11]